MDKRKALLRSGVSGGVLKFDQLEKHIAMLDRLDAERVQQEDPQDMGGRRKKRPKR